MFKTSLFFKIMFFAKLDISYLISLVWCVTVGSGGVSSDGSSGGGGGSGWVFGVPLAKCIANDAHLRRGGDGLSDRQMLSPLNTPQPTLRNR